MLVHILNMTINRTAGVYANYKLLYAITHSFQTKCMIYTNILKHLDYGTSVYSTSLTCCVF